MSNRDLVSQQYQRIRNDMPFPARIHRGTVEVGWVKNNPDPIRPKSSDQTHSVVSVTNHVSYLWFNPEVDIVFDRDLQCSVHRIDHLLPCFRTLVLWMIGPHILLVASTTTQSQQVSAKDSGTLCQHLQSPKVVCEPQLVFIKEIECPGKSNDLDSGTLGSSSGSAPQTSVYLIRKTGKAQATGIELSTIETITG